MERFWPTHRTNGFAVDARRQLHARQIGEFLNGRGFAVVLTSRLQRARETCRLAGYGESAIIDANLRQWDYGE